VIVSDHDVNETVSTSQSSTRNNDHGPVGDEAFKAAIVEPYPPAGADAGKLSPALAPAHSSTLFVGLYVPETIGTPPETNPDPASLNVRFAPAALTPVSDNNNTD
jgi:hypothetical protein